MNTLIELAKMYNDMYGDAPHLYTDKNTGHTYLPVYEHYMEEKRNYAKVLELGVATGGSIHLWTKYFHDYNIDGIDICSSWFNPRPFQQEIEQDGKVVVRFDTDSRQHIHTKIFEDESYDFVIDDGDHNKFSQIDTFLNYFSKTSIGGVYFIEDMESREHVDFVKSNVIGYLDNIGCSCEIYEHAPLVKGWDAMLVIKRLNKGAHLV